MESERSVARAAEEMIEGRRSERGGHGAGSPSGSGDPLSRFKTVPRDAHAYLHSLQAPPRPKSNLSLLAERDIAKARLNMIAGGLISLTGIGGMAATDPTAVGRETFYLASGAIISGIGQLIYGLCLSAKGEGGKLNGEVGLL